MPVKERLIEFIKYKNLSIRRFEEICNMPFTTINNIKTSLQPDRLHNIYQHFPELNFVWLLIGEEQMLRDHPTQLLNQQKQIMETSELTTALLELGKRDMTIAGLQKKIAELEEQLAKSNSSLGPGEIQERSATG